MDTEISKYLEILSNNIADIPDNDDISILGKFEYKDSFTKEDIINLLKIRSR